MKFTSIFLFILLLAGCAGKESAELQYDVVIVGGGASGTMAGIQSARLGSTTLILEETLWLGGMLTSAGVSAIDGNYKLYSGLWQEFRERLYDHYGGQDSVKTGWVSNVLFEPDVAAEILWDMSEREQTLNVWFNSTVSSLDFVDGKWNIILNKNGRA